MRKVLDLLSLKSFEKYKYFIAIFLVSCVFFREFIFFEKLPVTSGDPAVRYWDNFYGALQIKSVGFPLWDFKSSTGISVFQNDIVGTSFSLYSIFSSVFNNFSHGYVFYLWLEIIFFGIVLTFYLQKILKYPFWVCLTCFILVIFTPGFLNEYFFNVFGGYLFIPLLLIFAENFNKKKGYRWSFFSGALLAFIHWSSNIAAAQFSAIFLSLYIFTISWDRNCKYKNIHHSIGYLALTLIGWIGLMSFYLVPFLMENLTNARSNNYSIDGGFQFFDILKSVIFPFTSWVFFDYKMITTGFLTRFESSNLYSSILFLPSLVVLVFYSKGLKKQEKFFIAYSITFLLFAWVNKYIPILGLFTKYTKTTAWWRSLPIFFISTSFFIGAALNVATHDNWRSVKNVPSVIQKIFKVFSAIYLLVTVVFLSWIAIYFCDKLMALGILKRFSVRPVTHLQGFFERYYMVWPQLPCLLLIPATCFLMFYCFNCFLKDSPHKKNITILFLLATLFHGVSITQLYFPFNNGVKVVSKMIENDFLKRLDPTDRIGIIVNTQSKIEEKIIKDLNYKDTEANLDFNLALSDYPEISRLQSNISSYGNYFIAQNISTYTKGNSFTNPYLVEFHKDILNGNIEQLKKFEKTRYDLKLNIDSFNNPLLKYLSLRYILSSLPENHESLQLKFKGNNYYIYENSNYLPLFYFAKKIQVFPPNLNIAKYKEYLKENTDVTISEEKLDLDNYTGAGQIKDIKFLKDKVTLKTESADTQFLVFSDTFNKNWTSSVDGVSTKIIKVNYLFKGIAIPAGIHSIEFSYKNNSFYLGSVISFFTFLFLLILIVHSLKRAV